SSTTGGGTALANPLVRGPSVRYFDVLPSEHLREKDVGNLWEPGGSYFLAIPDHRYCFDHFLAPSTIVEVLDANMRKAGVHSAANFINMRAMVTHNKAGRHWNGDHG